MKPWPSVVNTAAIETQLKCERAADEKTFIAMCVMFVAFKRRTRRLEINDDSVYRKASDRQHTIGLSAMM